ncbi:ATP-binding protein [Stygiolobus caldivivus]|uniref:ATPase AAA n=1 Tax=Stygiolobus caldivivus TaxID=2824673 RepID=A0A8D5U651_9CREN|nr:ATP-binding protein [Stygiolobus caldivivus]BCU70023.1 ATPase AAA [Stygiolobus caldivivus]
MNEIKQVLLDQKVRLERKLEKERVIERDVPDLKKYLSRPNVLAILGVRRSGKSTLAETLLRGENFGYINFDDDRLAWVKVEDLHKLEKAVYELFGEVEYFLFDEIHNVNGWELFVSRLREEGKKVVITGSNSKMLSGELATALTGRHTDFTLFPFSFSEYLRFKGVRVEKVKDTYTTPSEGVVKRELENYIREGGFPEVLKISEDFIFTIFSDIVYKDVVQRLKIKRVESFKSFTVNVLKYFSNEVSLSKLSKTLKLSNNTVEEWFNGLINAYVIITSERFTSKPREGMTSQKKVYVIDPGFITSIALDSSKGRVMENLVALQLSRVGEKLFYLKGDNYEIDFMVNGKAIQVTYASGKDEIPKREVEGLEKVKAGKKVVITWDYEDEVRGIKFIPLWKFLLNTREYLSVG